MAMLLLYIVFAQGIKFVNWSGNQFKMSTVKSMVWQPSQGTPGHLLVCHLVVSSSVVLDFCLWPDHLVWQPSQGHQAN